MFFCAFAVPFRGWGWRRGGDGASPLASPCAEAHKKTVWRRYANPFGNLLGPFRFESFERALALTLSSLSFPAWWSLLKTCDMVEDVEALRTNLYELMRHYHPYKVLPRVNSWNENIWRAKQTGILNFLICCLIYSYLLTGHWQNWWVFAIPETLQGDMMIDAKVQLWSQPEVQKFR